MNLKNITGNKVLELRAKADLFQGKLATELGVNVATVSAWENNYHQPSPRYAARLQAFFNLPFEEIFTFSEL